jgi:3-mercaptopyruvate sulfurtransferase SseA
MSVLCRISVACLLCLFLTSAAAWADPSKYPQFAALANSLDVNINPEFIHMDQLVKDILEHKSLTLVDVRSADEYAAQHITGAISVPLEDLAANPTLIPKKGFVVLY